MKVCRHNVNEWCNIRALSLGSSRISPCLNCPFGANVTVVDKRAKSPTKGTEHEVKNKAK